MQLPPLPLIDNCLFVDNSMLELLNTCPRALQYNRLNQRVSTHESPSLNFGSAIHLALEFRYKRCAHLACDPFDEAELSKVLAKQFNEHPTPSDDFRNLNWALEIMKQYNMIHGEEDFKLLEYEQEQNCTHCEGRGWQFSKHEGTDDLQSACPFCNGTGKNKLMVELPFALPLFRHEDVQIMYSGRIDLPILRDDNQIFVMDHKTTSLLGPTFFDDKKMSAQQKGYAWSFEQLTGMKVRGYEVNALRIKEPPAYVTNGTEPKRGGKKQSVEDWWRESLVRERFLLNEGELNEWRNNAIELVSEFFWHYSRGVFPMKTSWCVGKFGRCPYFDVCSTHPPEDRLLILNSGLYQDNTWSPLKEPSQSKQK